MTSTELRLAVGKRLQSVRGTRDQRTFAEAVESVQQTISKYERGEIPRSWLFLARLRTEEGVDLNRLLGDFAESEETERRQDGSGQRREGDGRHEGNGRHAEEEERPAAEERQQYAEYRRPRLVGSK